MLNWTPGFSADRGVGNLLSVIDSVSQVGYGVAIWGDDATWAGPREGPTQVPAHLRTSLKAHLHIP